MEKRAIDAERELETMKIVRQVMLSENSVAERRSVPTRRIEYASIICQLCQKSGHTADRCRTLNRLTDHRFRSDTHRPNEYDRFPRRDRNGTQNNEIFNNTNNSDYRNRQDNRRTEFVPLQNRKSQSHINIQRTFTNNRQEKYCNFCRRTRHEIDECRNVARQNNPNTRNSGNLNTPVRNEGTQGNVITRPSRVIAELDTENEQ